MGSKPLGVMVCETGGNLPFPEKNFYRQLCLIGYKLGIQVFVFSPEWIHWNLKQVNGYTYDPDVKRWVRRVFPIPKLIYDRCFYKNRRQILQYQRHITRLKTYHNAQFLSRRLRGKWTIQQTLLKNKPFQAHIPNTEIYVHPDSLIQWFKSKQDAFLKPHAGSQGRGVIHIARTIHQGFAVKGRTHRNQPFEQRFARLTDLLQWLQTFIGSRKYIIQDYLSLVTKTNQAYDLRSLVQKNGKGQWQITGMAVRLGQPGSITSNLHGGGSAREAQPFLEQEHGKTKAMHILSTIQTLSRQIPPLIEQEFGQFIEFGIDFGIDRQGRIWILEVNSKPGRASFFSLKNQNMKKIAVLRPMIYARYILDQQLGG